MYGLSYREVEGLMCNVRMDDIRRPSETTWVIPSALAETKWLETAFSCLSCGAGKSFVSGNAQFNMLNLYTLYTFPNFTPVCTGT